MKKTDNILQTSLIKADVISYYWVINLIITDNVKNNFAYF